MSKGRRPRPGGGAEFYPIQWNCKLTRGCGNSEATKTLSKRIYEFTELTYRETGARLVILGSYVNEEGVKQIAWYVILRKLSTVFLIWRCSYDFNDFYNKGQAFKTARPDWDTGAMYQLFEEYVDEYLTASDSGSPQPVRVSKPCRVLPVGPTGLPILPASCLDNQSCKDTTSFSRMQKDVLRAYLRACYSMF